MVFRVVVAATTVILVGSCGGEPPDVDVEGASDLTVTSKAFEAGGSIPVEHTCDGEDTSPPIRWTGTGVAEWVVIMRDPDADGFVHWLLYGIPGDVTDLRSGEVPSDAHEGANDFAGVGYRGPCPPEGDELHRYEITVYGLERASGLPHDATLQTVAATIDPLVAASGTITGTYGR